MEWGRKCRKEVVLWISTNSQSILTLGVASCHLSVVGPIFYATYYPTHLLTSLIIVVWQLSMATSHNMQLLFMILMMMMQLLGSFWSNVMQSIHFVYFMNFQTGLDSFWLVRIVLGHIVRAVRFIQMFHTLISIMRFPWEISIHNGYSELNYTWIFCLIYLMIILFWFTMTYISISNQVGYCFDYENQSIQTFSGWLGIFEKKKTGTNFSLNSLFSRLFVRNLNLIQSTG